MKAEIIHQPYSGEFEERIYDVDSAWKSQFWAWIKFTDENGIEKVGQFRGFPKGVKVSKAKNEIIVLTSDCAFRLDSIELNLIEMEKQSDYGNIEVSPNGTFIFSEFSSIYKMGNSLSEMECIESPFEMDLIEFKNWNGNILEFECVEMRKYEKRENMQLDSVNWAIKPKKTHHNNV